MTNITTTTAKFSLAPSNFAEAMDFAKMVCRSNMVPKDYQNKPENVLIAVQWGYELGLQPLQSMQNISVINGRPAVWGDSMLALVKGSGLCEYVVEEPTATSCTCKIKRKGEPEAIRVFSIDDAKKAGLWGKQGPWTQYPQRMLQMRARAWALRDVFPDVLRGMHIAEEARDIPLEEDKNKEKGKEKDMGEAQTVPPVQPVKPVKEIPEDELLEIQSKMLECCVVEELQKIFGHAWKRASEKQRVTLKNIYDDRKAEIEAEIEAVVVEVEDGNE